MTKIIQVIMVDDHRLFRMGAKACLRHTHPDICICDDVDSGEALFALPSLATADLVLLDINLPGGICGEEITVRLRREYPAVKILAISGENSAETIQAMLMAGIDGFISKQHSDIEEFAESIRTVTSGTEYFGRDIAAIMFDVFVSKKKTSVPTDEFTEREKEIILLSRDGLSCKEISARLEIGASTVHSHKKNIFQKLGINNTMEMVQYALKRGIIRVDN